MKKKILMTVFSLVALLFNAQNNKPVVFHVTPAPNLVVYAGNHNGSDQIDKAELLGLNELLVKAFDSNKKESSIKFIVVSFEFSARVNGKINWIRCNGPTLTEEIKKIVKTMKPGEKIYFDNVKAKGPDKVTRSAQGISLTVK